MRVDIWTDLTCPWCYIGRRRFETARARLEPGFGVDVVYRSFELDPEAPDEPGPTADEARVAQSGLSAEEGRATRARIARLAAAEGIDLDLTRARPTNTRNAHRVLQLAQIRHCRPVVEERFQRAYFAEGAVLSDTATLLDLATDAGLREADVRRVLSGPAFTLQVRIDEREAEALGVDRVPFFLLGGKERISGAPAAEALEQALRSAVRSPGVR